MGGDDDPTTDYDEGAIRFGSMGDTTMLTEAYVTTAMHMAKDLKIRLRTRTSPCTTSPATRATCR